MEELTEDVVEVKRKLADALQKEHTMLMEKCFTLRSGNQEMFLYLERVKLRKVSLFWVILCLVSAVCTVDAILRYKITHSFCGFVAFLFNWRALYIENNAQPSLIAVALVTVCILT